MNAEEFESSLKTTETMSLDGLIKSQKEMHLDGIRWALTMIIVLDGKLLMLVQDVCFRRIASSKNYQR